MKREVARIRAKAVADVLLLAAEMLDGIMVPAEAHDTIKSFLDELKGRAKELARIAAGEGE